MQTPPTILSSASDSAPTTSSISAGSSTDVLSGDPFAVIFARMVQGQTPIDLTKRIPQTAAIPTATDPSGVPVTDTTESSPLAQFTARGLSELIAGLPELAKVDDKTTIDPTAVPEAPVANNDLISLLPELAALVGTPILPLPVGNDRGATAGIPTKQSDATTASTATTSSLLSSLSALTGETQKAVPIPPGTESAATAASSERRLQPFQIAPLLNPRFTDSAASDGKPKDASASNLIPAPPSIESLLGGGRSGRIIIDKDVLGAVDKLLRRSTPKSDILEKGASVLTPDELRPQASTVEDRNATALARVDKNEFVNRVVQAFERAHTERPKMIEIELNPPSLGKLRLQVTEIDGQLSAKIEVHSDSSRSLLLDNLPTLDRQLGEQGVQIQRFTVDHMNTGPSGSTDLSGNAQQQAQQEAQRQAQEQQRQGYQSSPGMSGEDEDGNRGSNLTVADLLRIADGMDRLV